MINVAILVSGGGTNLQALIDHEAKGGNPFGSIKLVISSNENAFALKRASLANIKSVVVSKHHFESQKKYDLAMLDILKKNDIEVVVLAGFMQILGSEFISSYENRIINVHPSLIPSFCGKGFYGLNVHEAALKRGVKITGATVHFVNEVCDAGPIISQKAVEVKKDDTPETLQKRVMMEAEWKLLPEALTQVCKDLSMSKDHKC